MFHLESRRGWSLETVFSVRAARSLLARILIGRDRLGCVQEMAGQRRRLEFFKKSRPTQVRDFSSNLRTVTRFLFLRDHQRELKVGVNNRASVRGMTSVVQ
jgi:hypothetical protein